MDIFKKLPPELRLQLFIHVRSQRYMLQLITASPIVLRQYARSKSYIAQVLVTSDLDDEMIQDAMGIILFPPWGPKTDDHLRQWTEQRLPDPFKQHNRGLISEIDTLYRRLLLFVEDYVTKATAVFPPREYLCIPRLSTLGSLTFKGQTITTRFDAARLHDAERRRLLRAFLRYELICKICFRIFPRHPEQLCQYHGRGFRPSEWEAIQCVHNYLESLYGAMFAQCGGDAWLPDVVVPVGSHLSLERKTGLLYPDSLYISADAYASDMGLPRSDIISARLLACCGLNLAVTLLRAATSGRPGRERLERWFKEFYEAEFVEGFSSSLFVPLVFCLGLGYIFEEDDVHNDDDCGKEAPGMYRLLYPRMEGSSILLHRNIYRQRAWAFLDDARLYPPHGVVVGPQHFPTLEELEGQLREAGEDEEWFLRPTHTRALHRSQTWHDERHRTSSSSTPASAGSDAGAGDRVMEEEDSLKSSNSQVEARTTLPSRMEDGYFGRLSPFWH